MGAMYDVLIAGGGPAGLSAALTLGRCRRHVLLCDTGKPRNRWSHGLHGFLSRDGIPPAEFLSLCRGQLGKYSSVELRAVEVADVRKLNLGFEAALGDGSRVCARKVLLATGVVDELPPIAGMEALYGTSVFHCPYCDGWEMRDQPTAVYAKGAGARELALKLTVWTGDIVLCSDGATRLSAKDLQRLTRAGIKIVTKKISALQGRDGLLEHIVFADGEKLPRRSLFVQARQRQASEIPARLGCNFSRLATVVTGQHCDDARVPGLYLAGDASHDVQMVAVAAAEGIKAAVWINDALLRDSLEEQAL